MSFFGSVTNALAGGALKAVGEIPGLPGRGQIKAVGANITNPDVNIYGAPNPGSTYSISQAGPSLIGGQPVGAPQVQGQQTGGSYFGAAGGGGGAPAVDPALVAAYNQAIGNTQAAYDRQGNLLNSGYSGIDASYQNALNQLLLGKNQAESGYKSNKQQTATDYVGAKNTIGANAGSVLSGLLRLLGSRGAGGGSAYNRVAPEAVARGATLQRTDVGNTFGANNQALDTNWGNYMTGYNNELSSAANQKEQQRKGLESTIDTNRASLLQSLAQLTAQRDQASGGSGVAGAQPFLDQANSLLDRTSNYTTAPINYQTQAYNAPSLASYTTNPQAAPSYEGQQTSNDYFSPYLQALLGKKQRIA